MIGVFAVLAQTLSSDRDPMFLSTPSPIGFQQIYKVSNIQLTLQNLTSDRTLSFCLPPPPTLFFSRKTLSPTPYRYLHTITIGSKYERRTNRETKLPMLTTYKRGVQKKQCKDSESQTSNVKNCCLYRNI